MPFAFLHCLSSLTGGRNYAEYPLYRAARSRMTVGDRKKSPGVHFTACACAAMADGLYLESSISWWSDRPRKGVTPLYPVKATARVPVHEIGQIKDLLGEHGPCLVIVAKEVLNLKGMHGLVLAGWDGYDWIVHESNYGVSKMSRLTFSTHVHEVHRVIPVERVPYQRPLTWRERARARLKSLRRSSIIANLNNDNLYPEAA